MSAAIFLAAATLTLVDCAPRHSGAPEEDTAETEDPIVGGTVDETHTAVVEVLLNSGFCSGTIVQVQGGVGYVLTAAHCCTNGNLPVLVALGGSNGAFNGTLLPVALDSIAQDPCYVHRGFQNGNPNSKGSVHDFCMFKVPAPQGTPSIPVARPGGDRALGSPSGTLVQSVGYGKTSKNETLKSGKPNKPDPRLDRLRMETLTEVVPSSLDNDAFNVQRLPGLGIPCKGDSGGPALLPAVGTQGQQIVVGTESQGDCNLFVHYERVTSATGNGGFISDYLNGTIQDTCGCRARGPIIAAPVQGSASDNAACACLLPSVLCPSDARCCDACDGDGACCDRPNSVVPGGGCCPAGTVESCDDGSCCTSACVGGQCCPPPNQVCSDACVDTQMDVNNCGTCGNVCLTGQTCQGGTCACPSGTTLCDQTCVDTQTNVDNCGTCGNVCPMGATCEAGGCACPSGTTRCDQTCADTQTDANNCGSCGNVCLTGACEAGTCACPSGTTRCGQTCVDTQTDANNCGTCGNVCPTDATCTGGACLCGPSPCSAGNDCILCVGASICAPQGTLLCLGCPNVHGNPFPIIVPTGTTCCGNVYNGNNICEPGASCNVCQSKEDPAVLDGECFVPPETPLPCPM